MSFQLHPNLAKKTFVHDLPLCRILLEDNSHYPWLFLVPRRADISKIMDLSQDDQRLLIEETDQTQKILWDLFKPEQLNVAAIGNKTPQLHVHVIARYSDDPAWPGTVWDHPASSPYTAEAKTNLVQKLQSAFSLAGTRTIDSRR